MVQDCCLGIASILRPALRDYGGQVAHRATTETKSHFHGSSIALHIRNKGGNEEGVQGSETAGS
jgi:hypothetical protein